MSKVSINEPLSVTNYVSIPILKRKKEESSVYALRLTPLGQYGLTELQNLCKTFDDYIFIREESKAKKEHYHAVIWATEYEDEVRNRIRDFLKLHFPEPAKRGDANRQYNLSTVQDLEITVTYLLKDGGEIYTSPNVNTESVEKLKKKSFRKYSKEEFMTQLEVLKTSFKDKNTELGDMMVAIIKLKAMYRQPINIALVYQQAVGFNIHANPDTAEDYVRGFFSRRM